MLLNMLFSISGLSFFSAFIRFFVSTPLRNALVRGAVFGEAAGAAYEIEVIVPRPRDYIIFSHHVERSDQLGSPRKFVDHSFGGIACICAPQNIPITVVSMTSEKWCPSAICVAAHPPRLIVEMPAPHSRAEIARRFPGSVRHIEKYPSRISSAVCQAASRYTRSWRGSPGLYPGSMQRKVSSNGTSLCS